MGGVIRGKSLYFSLHCISVKIKGNGQIPAFPAACVANSNIGCNQRLGKVGVGNGCHTIIGNMYNRTHP